jgi:hypothetical protein
MTSISDIRLTGDSLVTNPHGIYEPLSAPSDLVRRLDRFGDDYNLASDSHLFRFLLALCGESGAGELKKSLLYPKLQQTLESTYFTDLDRLYGGPLSLPRLSEEIYTIDPKNDILTQGQWEEVRAKDAAYRARCLLWMRAIMAGPTKQGIKLAAEAACGVNCDIVEQYRYIDNPTEVPNFGVTNSRNEFIIIPQEPDLVDSDRRRIIRLVDKLRPINSLPTIQNGSYLRSEVPVIDVDATSSRFQISTLVTGTSDINWPDVDLSAGYWVTTDEQEAPTFSFMDRQEYVTYLSVVEVIASSVHQGMFNATQRSLFSHLGSQDPLFLYSGTYSYAKFFSPIRTSTQWTTEDATAIVINDHYPLGYFAEANINFVSSPNQFWSSVEKFPTEEDSLTFNLGSLRQINFIDFEIAYKPIDIVIEYDDNGTWKPIEPTDQFQTSFAVTYLPAKENSWDYFECTFNKVQTQFIRLTFKRRDQNFPVDSADPFPWSIDIRNTRLMHTVRELADTLESTLIPAVNFLPSSGMVDGDRFYLVHSDSGFGVGSIVEYTNGDWHEIPYYGLVQEVGNVQADLFIEDQGVDILGNTFRTNLTTNNPDNVLDLEDDRNPTVWQSQPNPSRNAVEAIYFDLRTNYTGVTMGYLDTQHLDETKGLDGRSMAELAVYSLDGVVIDEVFIDPITLGPDMHIYYSLDDEADWDYKLWIPVPRSYKLTKGYHSLPRPTFVKYVKIEFTNLSASPYEPITYPDLGPVRFRRFPSWVQDFFNDVFLEKAIDKSVVTTETIDVDPLVLGFQTPTDNFSTSLYEEQRKRASIDTDSELKGFITDLQSQSSTVADIQLQSESQIQFKSPVMWQGDLINQLDTSRALSRKAQEDNDGFRETGWNAEQPLPTYDPISVQSASDLSQAKREKHIPSMWFPRKCRHEYQIVEGERPGNIAYFVSLRKVSFARRDYTVPYDEQLYFETLDDDSHQEVNEFVQEDWRYVVQP